MSRSQAVRTKVVTGLAVLTCAALAPVAAAGAASVPLTISPAAGTLSASPDVQISILGTTPKSIRSVKVTGTVSGAHTGKLRPYSAKQGASFVLKQPFVEGENATAVIKVDGRSTITRSFTIERKGVTPPYLNLKVTQPDLLDHFVTQPGLDSPKITVTKRAPKAAGSIFLTPLPSPVVHPGAKETVTISPVGPGGPMIVDGNGDLVWFRKLTPPDVAANLRLQRYKGKPVLTWWQGPVTAAAYGQGEAIIADTKYRTVATVKSGNGYKMDIHELELTDRGTALFTIYDPILVHLPGTPAGKLSPLLDSLVQEVDIQTGLVVWEWHSYGHVPLSQSQATPENSASYDAFHINSIQSLDGGREVFMSMRDTSTVYRVNRASGKILWQLGGNKSDFKLGKGARFWFQHHAQLLPGDRVSVFDDEAGPPQKAPASRGLILQLDRRRKTATVVRDYKRAPDTSAQSEGSLQILPGGNVFVGYGSTGYFSEFTPGGKKVFDANLPDGDGSYRNYRYPWSTTPATKPDVAARREGSGAAVYASWNGATDVAKWQVLAGRSVSDLAPLSTAARTGFETRVPVTGSATTYAVRALDSKGRTMATSAAVPIS